MFVRAPDIFSNLFGGFGELVGLLCMRVVINVALQVVTFSFELGLFWDPRSGLETKPYFVISASNLICTLFVLLHFSGQES